MKLIYIIILILIFSSCKENVPASAKTETFMVWGNCGMCEETIEGSLKQDGIYKADWDRGNKMMVVTYDTLKHNINSIHQKIAATGYDTEQERGNDEAYNNRPECCKYERKNQ